MPPRNYDPGGKEDDELQYGGQDLDESYPNRPINDHRTLPFHELFKSLFNPLNENKKQKAGPAVSRGKGRGGKLSSAEKRTDIIARFISRWRNEVGNDFYPALRLIIPEKDRDRPMYGLKEKAIGKLLVKLLKINPSSDDGSSLLNWKLPGQTVASRRAGDFAGRCYEVLSKRPLRTKLGNMRIAEVNEALDRLAAVSKEEDQLPIFERFYEQMNPEELLWLIRIILREMKIGATERTFLNEWHPDGDALFNVSSSLRRVCWELSDPTIRLDDDEAGIALMSCFQPQLAQFQQKSFQVMVEKMGCTPEDPEFWIEEKLDGERMQLHMAEDEGMPGRKRFAFWSRKAKDYTYLYGGSFEDENSALTRHIKAAFDPSLRNIILDGEMITWDPDSDIMVPFGTLKSAALEQQRNPFGTGIRPLYRVFDCLYFNDKDITNYTLRDRRKALDKCVSNVHRRLEIHSYESSKSVRDIEPALRKVVAEASEGLVLKNPRSSYRLNSRNDDWMKVKPEYMTEFGESLDCLVIGGYYGSGHRGGRLSSFLCGLRADQNDIQSQGANHMKFLSFCKVGGGFRAEDYANIKHHTEGKWIDWDKRHPPSNFIALGGPHGQTERPDVWIKPTDSVVLEVKAASVDASDSFKTGYTLRFPRFKTLRIDKDWESALSVSDFIELKRKAEAEANSKEMTVDSSRRKITKRLKKELVIAGNDSKVKTPYGGPKTAIFDGLTLCIMNDMVHPVRKNKAELEQIIKSNGGAIVQSPIANDQVLCIGDKRVVKVASLIKAGHSNIIKPIWILDALKQAEIDGPGRERYLVPFEPVHMFHMTPDTQDMIEANVDAYGDSYTRDVSVEELKKRFDDMIHPKNSTFSATSFLSELEARGHGLGEMQGSMFRGLVAWFTPVKSPHIFLELAKLRFTFAAGQVAGGLEDDRLTHIVVVDEDPVMVKELRKEIARLGTRKRLPRIVSSAWLEESWKEGTVLDEESFAVKATG